MIRTLPFAARAVSGTVRAVYRHGLANCVQSHPSMMLVAIAAAWLIPAIARADAVTDWNVKACEVVVEANLGPLVANRVLAVANTAAYEAANALAGQRPSSDTPGRPAAGAAVDAAIAAAHHATLARLVPSQQKAVQAAYQAAMASMPDGPAKREGIAAGERAASTVLSMQADDGSAARDTYRPHTTPGTYVPTTAPAASHWGQRRPWVLTSADQFRPGPPPRLTSETWARDYNEIKALGARNSTGRSAEQTEIAAFWEATMPPIYHGLVRSVALAPGRDVVQNARLYAAVTRAIDDALIAVFDAKYHYNFWRPVTAIRNGDRDGNDATERDASWSPFVDTPMHPEYPRAHCVVAATVGTVLQAEMGNRPTPVLSTTSVTAKGAVRRWTAIDDFIHEVASARIYGGVHYRYSTEVGTAMGRRIGALAAAKYLRSSQ